MQSPEAIRYMYKMVSNCLCVWKITCRRMTKQVYKYLGQTPAAVRVQYTL
jgi:hypothetical protein